MLFQDLLDEKYKLLSARFEQLYAIALKNQTHPGDLLFVNENAAKDMKSSNHDIIKQYFF